MKNGGRLANNSLTYERQGKRTPADRHQQRESALYVDPLDSGLGWNRPQEKYLKKKQGPYRGCRE